MTPRYMPSVSCRCRCLSFWYLLYRPSVRHQSCAPVGTRCGRRAGNLAGRERRKRGAADCTAARAVVAALRPSATGNTVVENGPRPPLRSSGNSALLKMLRPARCARPLATRRGASDQRARLRAGRAVDRPSVRARRVTINEVRRPWNGATKWRW